MHLFNMVEDPAEQTDLADSMPVRVDDMHSRLVSYLEGVNATIPDPEVARGPGPAGRAMGMGGGGMGMGN